MTKCSLWRYGLLCMLPMLSTGCVETSVLEPAPEAQIVPDGGMTARAEAGGVSVLAEAGAWQGDIDIEDAVTALRVTISNDSGRLVRIRYSDIGLITESGRRYAALPPYDIEGSITAPVLARRYRPVRPIGFDQVGFRVAAHYGTLYPTLVPFGVRPLYYDPFYYSRYYSYWDDTHVRIDLPTAEMLRRAVPEGVLEDGGRIEGFFYFEKLPENLSGTRINFHIDLVDAIDDDRFATLYIPFVATTE